MGWGEALRPDSFWGYPRLDFGLNETQISKILGHVDTRMVGQVYLRKIQDDTMLKAAEKIEMGMKGRSGRAI